MVLYWMLIFSLFSTLYGQDLAFQYKSECYSVGNDLTLTAEYTGSGTVTAVQWYYSGQSASNLLVLASTCQAVTPVDAGYPSTSRMSFECNLATNTFKLILTGLKEEELDRTWGATFSLSVGLSPTVKQLQITVCGPTTSATSTANTTATTMSTSATTTATNTTELTTLSKKKSIFIGAGVGGGVFVLLMIFIIVTFYCKQKTKRQKYIKKESADKERVNSNKLSNRNAAYIKGNDSV